MSKTNYKVLCGDDCLHEGMTKEQIFAAIAEATGNVPSGVDDAFISKIKDVLTGNNIQFAAATQAEYNALVASNEVQPNTLYFITDESESNDLTEIYEDIKALEGDLENLSEICKEVSEFIACQTEIESVIKIDFKDPNAEINKKRWLITPATTGIPDIDSFYGVREPIAFGGSEYGGADKICVITVIETYPVAGRRWQAKMSCPNGGYIIGLDGEFWELVSSPPVTFRTENADPLLIGYVEGFPLFGFKYYKQFIVKFRNAWVPMSVPRIKSGSNEECLVMSSEYHSNTLEIVVAIFAIKGNEIEALKCFSSEGTTTDTITGIVGIA